MDGRREFLHVYMKKNKHNLTWGKIALGYLLAYVGLPVFGISVALLGIWLTGIIAHH